MIWLMCFLYIKLTGCILIVLVTSTIQAVELIDRSETESQLGLMPHEVKVNCIINPDVRSTEPHQLLVKLHSIVKK